MSLPQPLRGMRLVGSVSTFQKNLRAKQDRGKGNHHRSSEVCIDDSVRVQFILQSLAVALFSLDKESVGI